MHLSYLLLVVIIVGGGEESPKDELRNVHLLLGMHLNWNATPIVPHTDDVVLTGVCVCVTLNELPQRRSDTVDLFSLNLTF